VKVKSGKKLNHKLKKYDADRKDLTQEELSYLNNCLKYGHIEIVGDGERQ